MSDMRKYLDLLTESTQETKEVIQESVNKEENFLKSLSEGKHGAHGKDLDNAIEVAIKKLGDDPTLEEIYTEVTLIRKNADLGGFFVNKGYRERSALGAIAKALGLPGLYTEDGDGFVSTDQDDANRYQSYGSGSMSAARELAKKGYLTKEKASKLGVLDIFGMEIGDRDQDKYSADRTANTSAKDERGMRRKFKRFQELVAKAKESEQQPEESINFESAIGLHLYKSLLVEGLDYEEQKELDALADELAKFKWSDETYGENVLQAVQDYEDWADAEADKEFDKADAEFDKLDKEQSAKSGSQSGSLAKFAKSGKGGIKNDPDEKEAISELQERLTKLGFDTGGTEGIYGPKTEQAVKDFQTMMGTKPDGDAGPKTINAIIRAETVPGLKEFYTDMGELLDLIKKGAKFTKGGEESSSNSFPNGVKGDWNQDGTVDIYDKRIEVDRKARGLTTDSIDFRNLISIVEGNLLLEAVSEQEQARAMELYNKHKEKFTDGEYGAALPKPVADRMTEVSKWASGETVASTDDKEDNKADDKDAEVDNKADDADSKDNDETLSIEDFNSAREIAEGLHAAWKEGGFLWTGLGTTAGAGEALLGKIKNHKEFVRVADIYKSMYKDSLGDDLAEEYGGSEKEGIMGILDRLEARCAVHKDEQDKPGLITLWWEGQRYFVNEKPDENGEFWGQDEDGSINWWQLSKQWQVQDPELLRLVKAESASRTGAKATGTNSAQDAAEKELSKDLATGKDAAAQNTSGFDTTTP
jgi:hypothetical protein